MYWGYEPRVRKTYQPKKSHPRANSRPPKSGAIVVLREFGSGFAETEFELWCTGRRNLAHAEDRTPGRRVILWIADVEHDAHAGSRQFAAYAHRIQLESDAASVHVDHAPESNATMLWVLAEHE